MSDRPGAVAHEADTTDLYDTPAPWPWTTTASAIGIYVGFSYLVVALVMWCLAPSDPGVVVMAELVGASLLTLVWLRRVVRSEPSGSWRSLFGLRLVPRDLGLGAAAAAPTYVVNLLLGVLLVARLGADAADNSWKELADDLGRSTFAAVAIVATAVTPIIEEVVFRAMLLRTLVERFRVADRVAVAALVYGLVHVVPYVAWQANLTAFIQAGVFGASMCVVARLTGRLGPSIVALIMTNVVTFGVLIVNAPA